MVITPDDASPTAAGGTVGCGCIVIHHEILSCLCMSPFLDSSISFFFGYLQRFASYSLHMYGFRSCRLGQKGKNKKFLSDGKETTTMCATFCSPERSSGTKHFD